MKTRLALVFCLALAAVSRADEPAAPPIATDSSRLTADQLEQLVGPIALYPDALIALILPAATAPADIVLAARYLKDDGDPAAVASRSWDESVKSLVHYAEVVKWMDDNLSWTKQLGEAFRDQPAEVMQAIQRLRAKARAAGTLFDSPQQQVLIDSDVISIIPAQANYLYVPYYDPLVVYAPRPEFYGATTFITYSSPFAVGAWLRFDCDWRQRTVWTIDRHWTSHDRHDWRHPVFPGQAGYVADPNRHPWRPPTSLYPRMSVVNSYRREEITHPAPVNAPARPAFAQDNPSDRRNDSRDRPQRNDARARDPNFVGPVAMNGTATATPTSPAPAIMPPPSRRNDSGDQPNRTLAFQNPPAARPAPANIMTVTAPPPANYAAASVPTPRLAPAFTGPVAGASSQPAVSSLPQIRMPVAPAAPAPAPVAPAAPPASDDRRRGANDSDQKKQPN